jgi:hypothetical protein
VDEALRCEIHIFFLFDDFSRKPSEASPTPKMPKKKKKTTNPAQKTK